MSLRSESVHVERRPVDRAAKVDADFRERVIDAEASSEQAVVSKEARVKEELVVKKDVEQRTETVSDTVRSTKVDIEDGAHQRLEDGPQGRPALTARRIECKSRAVEVARLS